MLIKAYDKNYLEDVSDNLGTMLEYARGCSFDPRVFWEMFVSSKVAVEIENGNPKYQALEACFFISSRIKFFYR